MVFPQNKANLSSLVSMNDRNQQRLNKIKLKRRYVTYDKNLQDAKLMHIPGSDKFRLVQHFYGK